MAAQHTLHRLDFMGGLTPRILKHLAQAFRTLHCRQPGTDMKIIIRGEWWTDFHEPIFINSWASAVVVAFNRKTVTIEITEESGIKERVKVELVLPQGEGFTEIMFVTTLPE